MAKDTQEKSSLTKDRLLWSALIPQFILLLLSMLWINFSPKDNVVNYFNIDLWVIVEGLLAGTGLAIAGYGFYIFCKKTKKLYATVELFENILAPSFSILNSFDIIVLSLFASFCEEIFFRGLVLPKFSIFIASIAFGLLHLPSWKYWIYTVWATLSGFVLGWLFIVSNSLWLPIIAHATNNIIGMFMLKKLKPN